MKRSEKEFDTTLGKPKRITCDTCNHNWKTDKQPTKIKQGMIVIEDQCPNCGEYISKCV